MKEIPDKKTILDSKILINVEKTAVRCGMFKVDY